MEILTLFRGNNKEIHKISMQYNLSPRNNLQRPKRDSHIQRPSNGMEIFNSMSYKYFINKH